MNAATWSAFFERYGVQPLHQSGELLSEPFQWLAAEARRTELAVGPASSISVTASTASMEYSRARISVTVSCPCPSTEVGITMATEAAFILARRMVNEAAGASNLPPLEG